MKIKILSLSLFLSCLNICYSSKDVQYGRLMRKLKINFLNLGLKEDSSATPPPIDLVFVVDESSCIGKTSYVMTLRFLKKLLDFFSVSPGTTRVGLITYSDVAKKRFTFDNYSNRKAVQKTLLKLSQSYEGKESSFLGKGLSAAVDYFNGFTRPKTKRILVAVSNGAHGSDADLSQIKTNVDELEKLGVHRFVFTVGNRLHASNIQSIISKPSTTIPSKQFHFVFKSKEAIRWVSNLLPEAYYVYCNKPGTWRDECQRRCECVNGHIINCQRVRQEVMSMSVEERTRFIETYKTLTSIEPYKSRYNKFIGIHARIFFDGIHESLQFLPWHRWYILVMENLLLTVDCRVTYPYWDWSLVSANPWDPSRLFGNRPDAISGRSVFSDPSGCVLDGPFGRDTGWRTQTGDCLRRELSFEVPDIPIVMEVLGEANFQIFELRLRINLHDTVHCAIGGTMCSLDSATVPEFFMHHGYIDKLWLRKQKQSAAFFKGIFDPPGQKITLSESGFTSEKFLDNEALPGYVNISYAEPVAFNAENVRKFCNDYSISELLSMRRKGKFSLYSEKAAKHFRISDSEKKLAIQYANKSMKIVGEHPLKESLTGEDRYLGFKLPAKYRSV